jgi:predicted nucleic acid-binding protein
MPYSTTNWLSSIHRLSSPFDPTDRFHKDATILFDSAADSFHDALCAVTMHRAGIYKVFSFDSDFWTLGFEVMPGRTR